MKSSLLYYFEFSFSMWVGGCAWGGRCVSLKRGYAKSSNLKKTHLWCKFAGCCPWSCASPWQRVNQAKYVVFWSFTCQPCATPVLLRCQWWWPEKICNNFCLLNAVCPTFATDLPTFFFLICQRAGWGRGPGGRRVGLSQSLFARPKHLPCESFCLPWNNYICMTASVKVWAFSIALLLYTYTYTHNTDIVVWLVYVWESQVQSTTERVLLKLRIRRVGRKPFSSIT